MDYPAIAAEIAKPAYAGQTDAQIAATLQAMTVMGPNLDVPVGSVIAYLALQGKLSGLKRYVAAGTGSAQALVAADELLTILSSPNVKSFALSSPSVYTALQGFLGALVADTANSGITSTDEAALLGMAANIMPFARNLAETISADVVNCARLGTVTG